jgi:hypothetical protein
MIGLGVCFGGYFDGSFFVGDLSVYLGAVASCLKGVMALLTSDLSMMMPKPSPC